MRTRIVEATNGPANWGKFLVAQFDEDEWARRSAVDPGQRLLAGRGWTPDHLLVVDLQTGEGAVFRPGGLAAADLAKRRIWHCPLYGPFLSHLYGLWPFSLDDLPDLVDLPDAPFSMLGWRETGGGRP